jgi:hypothetical protein
MFMPLLPEWAAVPFSATVAPEVQLEPEDKLDVEVSPS